MNSAVFHLQQPRVAQRGRERRPGERPEEREVEPGGGEGQHGGVGEAVEVVDQGAEVAAALVAQHGVEHGGAHQLRERAKNRLKLNCRTDLSQRRQHLNSIK